LQKKQYLRIKVLYSPTDVQVNCLKNNFKTYIKINIKTSPTCFGAVTPSSGSALLVLAKVTVVKIASYGTSVCGDVATSPHTDVTLASTSNVIDNIKMHRM
jgi:hypothetical protein